MAQTKNKPTVKTNNKKTVSTIKPSVGTPVNIATQGSPTIQTTSNAPSISGLQGPAAPQNVLPKLNPNAAVPGSRGLVADGNPIVLQPGGPNPIVGTGPRTQGGVALPAGSSIFPTPPPPGGQGGQGGQDAGGGGGFIDFPEFVTFGKTYPEIVKALGAVPQLGGATASSVATLGKAISPTVSTLGNANAPSVATLGRVSNLQGLDNNYWNSLFNDSRKKLNEDFFGKGGAQDRLAETLAARGNLGSSLEYDALNNLNKDFTSKLADTIANLGRSRAEQDYQGAQSTRQLQQERDIQNMGARNAANQLVANQQQERDIQNMDARNNLAQFIAGQQQERDIKNADAQNAANQLFANQRQERDIQNLNTKNAFSELALRGALSESADANKFGIGRFEQQVNLADTQANAQQQARQQLVDLLTSPDVMLNEGQQQNILNNIFNSPYYSSNLQNSVAPAAPSYTGPKMNAPNPNALFGSNSPANGLIGTNYPNGLPPPITNSSKQTTGFGQGMNFNLPKQPTNQFTPTTQQQPDDFNNLMFGSPIINKPYKFKNPNQQNLY